MTTLLRVVAVAGCGFLAACTQQQVVSPDMAKSLNFVEVNVDAATASSAKIRGFNLGEEQVETLFDQAITYDLSQRPQGPRKVAAEVSLNAIYIPNPVAGALLGSNYPAANATVQIRDVATGAQIGEPLSVGVGGGEAAGGAFRPGIIGAGMQRPEDQEFKVLSVALAKRIGDAIYGKEPSTQKTNKEAQ